MLREDNLIVGFAVGAVVPVLAFLLIDGLFDLLAAGGVTNRFGEPYGFRERTLALVSICVNLLPFRAFVSLRNDASTRGVFLATGIYAAAWVIVYGIELLGQGA